ncbi:Nuclear hormone receptor [Dirofilaria immitis]
MKSRRDTLSADVSLSSLPYMLLLSIKHLIKNYSMTFFYISQYKYMANEDNIWKTWAQLFENSKFNFSIVHYILLWTFGGIPEANSSNTELLLSTKTSPPSRSSKTSTVDTVTSASLLRPYQKSDSVTPTLSAFSTRTNSNPNKLQSRGIPVTAFNPLLTQAMMAAQIGLLSTPNTLLSMMQAATAHNSLIHHNRCNDRNGQIVPAVLHQLSALHSSQDYAVTSSKAIDLSFLTTTLFPADLIVSKQCSL